MARSARTADRVLTVSHAAARSIRQHLGVAQDRITVAHNGSGEPHPTADPWRMPSSLSLPRDRPIVLSLGNRIDRKSVVKGKSESVRVDTGGTPYMKKTK